MHKSFSTIFDSNSPVKVIETLNASAYSSVTDSQNISRIMTINEFQFAIKIDNINLFKIDKFFKKTEIAKKVNGFSEKFENQNIGSPPSPEDMEGIEKHLPSLGIVESFLLALTNADKDGRVLITKNSCSTLFFLNSFLFLSKHEFNFLF